MNYLFLEYDIEYELDKLISDFNIYEGIAELYIKNRARQLIRQLLSECKGRLIIRGGGIHTCEFLMALPDYVRKEIAFIVDNNKEKSMQLFPQYLCVSFSEYKQEMKDNDIVIISSFSNKQIMKNELLDYANEIQIIDLYEYFSKHNLCLQDYFYVDKCPLGYIQINWDTNRYHTALDYDTKGYYNRRIIGGLLGIRDIKNALFYIDEYISNCFDNWERYNEFRILLKILVEEIKKRLSERRESDVVINWIDAFSPMDMHLLKYVEEQALCGICFDKAYACIPHTTPAFISIFFGKHMIDDKGFSLLEEKNRSFVERLYERNYKVLALGHVFTWKAGDLVYGTSSAIDFHAKDGKVEGLAMAKYQWNGLNYILNSDKPVCIVLHSLIETHYPTTNPINGGKLLLQGTERKGKEFETQQEKSFSYLDEQLRWYGDLLGKKAIKIYFSDHGPTYPRVSDVDRSQPINERKESVGTWAGNGRIRTLLVANGQDIVQQKIKKIFSILDMKSFVCKLIDNPMTTNWEEILRDFAPIAWEDPYNEEMIKNEILKAKEPIKILHCRAQARGVVTESDKYIRNILGDEGYYLSDENEDNLIDYNQYKERISFLRNLAGEVFVDIYSNEHYKHTARLYDELEIERDMKHITLI